MTWCVCPTEDFLGAVCLKPSVLFFYFTQTSLNDIGVQSVSWLISFPFLLGKEEGMNLNNLSLLPKMDKSSK